MDEMFDTYTREGTYLGVRSKKECHTPGAPFYHKPAWVWIINSKNELLVQKRAACKKVQPNKWDMPSAGHVDAGETPLEGAIRETEEELGLKTEASEYRFLGEYIEDSCREIGQVFLLHCDRAAEEFVLQEDEVAEVKWLSFGEFKALLYSDDFTPFGNEYKDWVVEQLEAAMK